MAQTRSGGRHCKVRPAMRCMHAPSTPRDTQPYLDPGADLVGRGDVEGVLVDLGVAVDPRVPHPIPERGPDRVLRCLGPAQPEMLTPHPLRACVATRRAECGSCLRLCVRACARVQVASPDLGPLAEPQCRITQDAHSTPAACVRACEHGEREAGSVGACVYALSLIHI